MLSSEDLLQRKRLKMDDINYHTQDRENQNFDYNTLGVDQEGRPSNAMQTQTLIMPYTENHHSTENRDDGSPSQIRSPHLDAQESINDGEVDHRFLSDDEEERKKSRNDKREEAKVRYQFNIFRKLLSISLMRSHREIKWESLKIHTRM